MPPRNNLNRLRSELIQALEKPEIDYSQVLDLSSKIARLDPENVRFSVDAGLINRLGRELVAREETAVSELVKNAYDADATRSELTFENSDLPGGNLIIDDDGSGMTRDQLIDGFMRLSSTDKIEHPISPNFKRRRAGRKGIGRFAAQRLGRKLVIVTQTEEAKKALRVEIDWGRFEDSLDLTNISSRIEEVEKLKPQGTTLTIEGLTDIWPDTSISRVYRYLADLIQPFPLSKQYKKSKSKIDPGFEINLFRISNGELSVVASVEEMVYKYAVAEIEGIIDHKGAGVWSIKSERFSINEAAIEIGAEREDAKSTFKYLKDIHFKAYYYIYNAAFIPPTQNKIIRQMANERGGIRVYRNGFRVLPYGEPYNDWLRLDASYGRRAFLPPHANLNFFGFVEIVDPEGKLFQETSSREGLIENEAFGELVGFIYRVLTNAALRIAEERARKKTASQKNWRQDKSPIERLKDTTQNLNHLADEIEEQTSKDSTVSPEKARQTARAIRVAISELYETATQQEEENALRIEERGMLRVLAGLGLTIGEFTHEIRHRFPPIIGDADYFLRTQKKGEPHVVAQRLISHLNTFRTYTSYFDSAVSENARRELTIQDLSELLREFVTLVKPAANRYAITLHEPKIWGYDLLTCPMHPSEWVSILFNLFTNSQKAIKRAKTKGEIFLRAGRVEQDVYLEFSDNGDGIPRENEDRIFDAFFTTTSPANPMAGEQEETMGTGLGLKIVKDIVTSYGGDIRLVTPPKGYKTTFRVDLPRASDEDIDKYGY
jgi:signal transduction histidine kinase